MALSMDDCGRLNRDDLARVTKTPLCDFTFTHGALRELRVTRRFKRRESCAGTAVRPERLIRKAFTDCMGRLLTLNHLRRCGLEAHLMQRAIKSGRGTYISGHHSLLLEPEKKPPRGVANRRQTMVARGGWESPARTLSVGDGPGRSSR